MIGNEQKRKGGGGTAGAAHRVKDVHAQDPIHVAKRLKNNLDSITRDVTFGNGAEASMVALDSVRIFGNAKGAAIVDTGLAVKNTQQKDRQNWESCQAIMVRKVRHALWQHQSTVGGLQGLIIYLEMAWKYTHIFFSRTLTYRARIEHACYIIHFLRLWRAWIFLQVGYTVSKNFLTRETFVDTVMSCHSAILVIMFYAIYHPDTPLHMDRVGTDSVETHFSSQGSWVMNKRTYTFLHMLQMIHKLNWKERAITEGMVVAPEKAHHNDKLWRLEDLPCKCRCFGCEPSLESASVPADFTAKSAPDVSGDAKSTGCPCPVADCTTPESCKNDAVGKDITWALVAQIWDEQFRRAAATLALVGVGPQTNGGAKAKAKGAGKADGDGESLFDGPAARERWMRNSGWKSGVRGTDQMAADEVDDANEGTGNRPDSSLVGRYMRVPEAHFEEQGGSEQVMMPDPTSQCMAKVTKFKHATPLLRQHATFEVLVDRPGLPKTTPYFFSVAQVLAYVSQRGQDVKKHPELP